MTDTYELPELPPIPYLPNSKEAEERILGEWAREYARLAVKAERERCEKIAWELGGNRCDLLAAAIDKG